MFGPRSVACAIRAVAKGNLISRTIDDPWTLPVAVLLSPDGAVRWRWEGRSAGDRPDYAAIPEEAGLR